MPVLGESDSDPTRPDAQAAIELACWTASRSLPDADFYCRPVWKAWEEVALGRGSAAFGRKSVVSNLPDGIGTLPENKEEPDSAQSLELQAVLLAAW